MSRACPHRRRRTRVTHPVIRFHHVQRPMQHRSCVCPLLRILPSAGCSHALLVGIHSWCECFGCFAVFYTASHVFLLAHDHKTRSRAANQSRTIPLGCWGAEAVRNRKRLENKSGVHAHGNQPKIDNVLTPPLNELFVWSGICVCLLHLAIARAVSKLALYAWLLFDTGSLYCIHSLGVA